MAHQTHKTSSVDSKFPCSLPEDELLVLSADDFKRRLLELSQKPQAEAEHETTQDAVESLGKIDINANQANPFVDALKSAQAVPKSPFTIVELAKNNKTLTDNGDVTFKSTTSPLVDLFDELGRDIGGPRLDELLQAAWKEDSLAALKIVWNARSIHLGKGEQDCFYKAMGWFAKNHPVTLLMNLQWLVRPVIELKPEAAKDKAVMVEMEDAHETSVSRDLEILHGGSHGYFKDLLNVLVLAANGKLDENDNPRKVLHAPNPFTKKRRCPYPPILQDKKRGSPEPEMEIRTADEGRQLAKEDKHRKESENHGRTVKNLQAPFYRCLHATVARMFAEQLKLDLERLKSGKKSETEKITLAAKWAPSLQGFHDKHTLIATSIGEILFPTSYFEAQEDRTSYLRLAREAYRSKYLTPLRAHLDIVERKITKELFGEIQYGRVPSLAMDLYKNLFIRKDYENFAKYIEGLATGEAKISGAILTPASIVLSVMEQFRPHRHQQKATSVKQLLEDKQRELLSKAGDGQWSTLVNRVKQSGKLSSTISVCDVSGSMYSPHFPDGTAPIHSAIGLSLLVAEITAEPFGECLITFSSDPKVQNLYNEHPLTRRVSDLTKADWGMNTDFVAVFERLILPMAIENKVPAEEMVKQVIVFSDMQFDDAESNRYNAGNPETWESSFERIKRKFNEAGYELPLLVFWNLASRADGNTAAKPVTKNEYNTMIVSGYSQAMLKMFLDNGGFDAEEEIDEDDDEDDEMEEVNIDVTGQVVVLDKPVKEKKKKKAMDPEAGMRKAISHQAYSMLQVYD